MKPKGRRSPTFVQRGGIHWFWTAAMLLCATACFSERGFPRIESSRAATAFRSDIYPIALHDTPAAASADTRVWLSTTHAALAHMAPASARGALLTDQLTRADGTPVDVAAHFGRRFQDQHKLLCNLSGLVHSAQCAASGTVNTAPPPAWPGFDDVWIPIDDSLSLSGRLGLAREGHGFRRAPCIILLPGMLGDLHVLRTRDLAAALLAEGLHVLAVELRGCGRTQVRYPHLLHNFGGLESGDLRGVDEWLCTLPQVTATGVIGFCWGANIAILCAWDDGRAQTDTAINPRLAPLQRRLSPRRHFEAGVIAFSPTIDFEALLDASEVEAQTLENPVLAALQDGVRERAAYLHYEGVGGNLRRMIQAEFQRTPLGYPGGFEDAVHFLRLVPHAGFDPGPRLDAVRTPLLIVTAANDPLTDAQDAATLLASTRNRRVAGIILPGGGHVGFPAWARDYYYELVVRFFRP